MAESSKIEWTDATFNPWVGCTKVSPACDNCYAEDWAKRFGDVEWGNAPRRRTGEKNWNKPRKWNRDADAWEAENGRPRFVFCASLADVFDNQVPDDWRDDLWKLIKECDRLIWLLLTKRPQNIRKMLPADWGPGYPNVWLGTTVENQEIANRNVPELLSIPAAKRFLSIEPILGPVDLSNMKVWLDDDPAWLNALSGGALIEGKAIDKLQHYSNRVHWVISGGESGKNARPAHPDWYRSLRDQCQEAGVPFHFKQWGEWKFWFDRDAADPDWRRDYASMEKDPAYAFTNYDGGIGFHGERLVVSKRVGKKEAGRKLDGRTWDGRPKP